MDDSLWREIFRSKASIYGMTPAPNPNWIAYGTAGTVMMLQNRRNDEDVRIKFEKNETIKIWWRLTSSRIEPKGERALVLKAWAVERNVQEILAIRFIDQQMAIQFVKNYGDIYPMAISNVDFRQRHVAIRDASLLECKLKVFGFVRRMQNILPGDLAFYNIPPSIVIIIQTFCGRDPDEWDHNLKGNNICISGDRCYSIPQCLFQSIFGTKVAQCGTHIWTFEIKLSGEDSCRMIIGVSKADWCSNLVNHMIAGVHEEKGDVWGYGWEIKKNTIQRNDILCMMLNLDDASLSYSVNGKPHDAVIFDHNVDQIDVECGYKMGVTFFGARNMVEIIDYRQYGSEYAYYDENI